MNKKAQQTIEEGIKKAEQEEKIVTDELAQDYKNGSNSWSAFLIKMPHCAWQNVARSKQWFHWRRLSILSGLASFQ